MTIFRAIVGRIALAPRSYAADLAGVLCLLSIGQAFALDQTKMAAPTDEARRLMEMLRSQIERCWYLPPGAAESGVKVTLLIKLKQDATLDGDPVVTVIQNISSPQSRAVTASAMRAVKMCAAAQPFKMPADKYAIWSKNAITFDPSNP